MAENLSSIGFSIMLDFCIFLVLFILFLIYRKLRSQNIELDLGDNEFKEPCMNEAKYSLSEISWMIMKLSDLEISGYLGEWGFLYITLHRYILYTLYCIGFFGLCFLIPIYYYGSSDSYKDLRQYSITHIIKDDKGLILPALTILLFSLVVYFFARLYYKKAVNSDFVILADLPQDYVVYISNIPRQYGPRDFSHKLHLWLKKTYGNGIMNVYVVPDYGEIIEDYKKYEELSLKLSYLLHQEQLGIEGTSQKLSDEANPINLIENIKSSMEDIAKKIKENINNSQNTNSGAAFVICCNRSLSRELAEPYTIRNDLFQSLDWHKNETPAPSDIIWENIGTPENYHSYTGICINLLFIVIFLVILTPSSFSLYISTGLEEIGVRSSIGNAIGMYLPSLFLLIYQQIILPRAVSYLVKLEKHYNSAEATNSCLKKYLFYLAFYIFLYPVLGLQFYQIIEMILTSENDWKNELATSINAAGEFFTIFMVHQAFIKNGLDLLILPKYAKVKAKSLRAYTEIEKALAYSADDFDFSMEFAVTLNTLIICISFSIVYPIILIPSIIFFFIRVFAI
ncbi:unnamed protein product [Blepharisma stoltei]|uniref:CSC1-like protein n=1 Tax=Blepharisma stoltei TaxID=1481888 RepID=A0AAU9IC24_9CILI|nr:unnamed protein product [Blepharisma stoltei]